MLYTYSPNQISDIADSALKKLLRQPATGLFESQIQRLKQRFDIYSTTCPTPLIAPGVIVTAELRRQSELYLPISEITATFNRLYCAALNYPPILSSSPFYNALSWADIFVGLPQLLQCSANPGWLLETLLSDRELLTEFLFASFLPRRFYGGFERYPGQMEFIGSRLKGRRCTTLRCLDAACGTGEDSYGLARLFDKLGLSGEKVEIEGWTLEPLEVWAAAHGRFPHDMPRQTAFRKELGRLFKSGYAGQMRFSCRDLTKALPAEPFDLILCNGLLGGPIINTSDSLRTVIANLAGLLVPGGLLLAADSFHDGWKRKCPQPMLQALFEANGLQVAEAGEGLAGLKVR